MMILIYLCQSIATVILFCDYYCHTATADWCTLLWQGVSDRRSNLEELFNQMDLNRNGSLKQWELQSVLGADPELWGQVCRALRSVKDWDSDWERSISRTEFVDDIYRDSETMSDAQFEHDWVGMLSKNIRDNLQDWN